MVNCADGSDETKKQCGNSPCPTFLFKCNYGACIEKNKVCNGEKDCADNSDEEPPVCVKTTNNCAIYKYRCKNGECISDNEICDGKKDCKDSSDESEDRCGNIKCQPYRFRCAYGACLPMSTRCNGKMDCVDGSDENDCDNPDEVGNRFSDMKRDCLLLDQPANGLYHTSGSSSRIKDGEQLHMTCNSNYSVWGSQLFQCDNGTWTPPLHESYCRRTCPSLSTDPSHNIACFFNGLPTACEKPFEGTIANVTCKDSFAPYGGSPSLICQSNGIWNDEPVTCTQIVVGSGCFSPPHLPNGRYELIHEKEYRENAYVPPVPWPTLRVSCNSGYVLSNSKNFFACDKGQWLMLNESRCSHICPSVYPTASENVQCQLEGRAVSCEKALENTRLELTCTRYYKTDHVNPIFSCQKGEWQPPLISCRPECGLKIVNAETLVMGGSSAVLGEFPWVVAIYRLEDAENQQRCSGTLITRAYVLSAAQCFADYAGVIADESLYTLVAGKYYRDFNGNESDTQVRQIRTLVVHKDYRGYFQGYRDDIALIEVEPFALTETVGIACIDWSSFHENSDFQEGNFGVVAGWGLTEDLRDAKVLNKLVVPYVPLDTCKKNLDKNFFNKYYVSDKICVGYTNRRMSVCGYDRGGGLYFPRKSDSIYFVRGIVSLIVTTENGCNSNHYSLYTKVSRYLEWIAQITRRNL
ncbi:lipoprotein receptor [Oryctes borbonicus]|uniref:Lipoprotein receptor n=1 Tax=Oryctes borbonicus TaxID=1629725 RepID=A0A0T6BBZ9_9SCAR|nr:lipoprotein receptor [Oryctes borbonicus]